MSSGASWSEDAAATARRRRRDGGDQEEEGSGGGGIVVGVGGEEEEEEGRRRENGTPRSDCAMAIVLSPLLSLSLFLSRWNGREREGMDQNQILTIQHFNSAAWWKMCLPFTPYLLQRLFFPLFLRTTIGSGECLLGNQAIFFLKKIYGIKLHQLQVIMSGWNPPNKP